MNTGDDLSGAQRDLLLHLRALESPGVRDAFAELAVLLNAGESLEALFARILALLSEGISFDHIVLFVRDGDALRMVGCQPEILYAAGDRFPLEAGQMEALIAGQAGVVEYRPDRVRGPWTDAITSLGGRRGLVALLRDGEEVLGLFALGRNEQLPFSPDEHAFMGVVATLLTQAVANEQRIRRANAEIARSNLLNELSIKLNDGESIDGLFDELRGLLGRAIQFDYVGLAASTGDERGLRVLSWRPDDEPQRSWVAKETIGMEAVLARGGGVIEVALANESIGLSRQFASEGFQRSLLAVLSHHGEALGILHISRLSPLPFGAEDRAFLQTIATLFAQSVANQSRLERTIAEATEQRVIAEIAAAAAREVDATSLLAGLTAPLRRIIPLASVSFAYIDGDTLLYCDPSGARLHMPIGGPARDAVESGQCVVRSPGDELNPVAQAINQREGIAAVVLTAARSAGEIVGILNTGTRDPAYRFTSRDFRLFTTVAQVVGPAMANVMAAQRLRSEAIEERVVAEIASIAARESDQGALVGALWRPLRRVIPKPFLAFGYLDGESVLYPRPDGSMAQTPLNAYDRRALRLGQVNGPEPPDDLPPGNALYEFGVHATANTAAHSGGETIGFLVAGSREPGFVFGERELRLFRVIAQILGPAMENARMAARNRERAETQGILADVAAAAAREENPLAMLQAAINPIRRMVPKALLAYGHVEGRTSAYEVPGAGEVTLPLLPAEEEVLREGQIVTGRFDELAPEGHHARLWGVQSAVLTARYAGGAPTGILILATRDPNYVFGEAERHLCRRMVQIIGPAMEASRAAVRQARQSALYDLVLSSLSEAVVLIDDSGRCVFANPAATRLVGAIDHEQQWKTVDWFVPELPEAAKEAFGAALLQGRAGRARAETIVDGAPAWFDFEFVPLTGRDMRLLMVATDVTSAVSHEAERERHEAEMAQASRLAALGELVGGVAHELNNPLTAILGFAEMSMLSTAGEGLSEELGIIQKEALRARNIVRDLLFIARPGPVERTRVDLAAVVGHVRRLRKAEWASAGIASTVVLPETDYELRGNENQLTQVLLNLVTNAEHALAGRDDPRIAIRCAIAAGHITIEVTDNGHGMNTAIARRVFEPFFTTKQGAGTGLGLSLSYSIVASHHGTIDLHSEPGEGTTFRVTLPLEEQPAGAADAAACGLSDRARILVIDDEPSLRKVCQRLVASMGHDCSVAADSETALRLTVTENRDFDLILCDYRLMSDTADTVIDALAAVRPELVRRTVIATGAATDAGVVDIVARHRLGLIAKPYGIDEIATLLDANRRLTA